MALLRRWDPDARHGGGRTTRCRVDADAGRVSALSRAKQRCGRGPNLLAARERWVSFKAAALRRRLTPVIAHAVRSMLTSPPERVEWRTCRQVQGNPGTLSKNASRSISGHEPN